MSSPREVYCTECDALGIPRNSSLLRTLPENTALLCGMSVMHLGRNYLGNRGVLPLLRVLPIATSLHTLNFRDNGIRNEGVKAICCALRRHPKLRVLELSGNPFTYLAARQLVHLCEDSDTLSFVGVEQTLMTEPLRVSIVCRIQEAVKRRESRKRASRSPQGMCGTSKYDTSKAAEARMPASIVAEDATTLRKLSVGTGGDADLTSRLTRRNPSGIAERNEKEEVTYPQNHGESIEPVMRRPPLATPPMHAVNDISSWLDEEQKETAAKVEEATSDASNLEMEILPRSVEQQHDGERTEEEEEVAAEEEEEEVVAAEEEEDSDQTDGYASSVDCSGGDDESAPLVGAARDASRHRFGAVVDDVSLPSVVSTVSVDVHAVMGGGDGGGSTSQSKEADFLDLLFGVGSD